MPRFEREWTPMTAERLIKRDVGQIVLWHREDGHVWEMTAIANGGILGHPERVMLIKVGTIGGGIYVTDVDRLEEPAPDAAQYDHAFKARL